jgi:hypothetical protein
MGTPTAIWKIVLLGGIAVLLIALGAGMALVPDPSGSVPAYRQATACTAPTTATDNCYTVVPVRVVSASADHLRKGGPEEYVIVQAASGQSEIALPWQSEQDQVLLVGATGTLEVYRGQPVVLAVGGYRFDTLQNPLVAASQTGFLGWVLLALGLVFASAIVFTMSMRPRYRGASATPPSAEAMREAIAQLPPGTDPQVLERINEVQQRLSAMQAHRLRYGGPITRGQTIGIVIGCAVAVLGALLLRGLH